MVGFFLELWQRGLSAYDEMEGVTWEWQSIDGSTHKAPLAKENSGITSRIREKTTAQPQGESAQPNACQRLASAFVPPRACSELAEQKQDPAMHRDHVAPCSELAGDGARPAHTFFRE